MSLKNIGDVSYFRLNNEINRPVNGQIPLHKDKEALTAFSKKTYSLIQKLLTQSLIKLLTSLSMIILKKLSSINIVLNLLKNYLPNSSIKSFVLNPSWQPISFISSMH